MLRRPRILSSFFHSFLQWIFSLSLFLKVGSGGGENSSKKTIDGILTFYYLDVLRELFVVWPLEKALVSFAVSK